MQSSKAERNFIQDTEQRWTHALSAYEIASAQHTQALKIKDSLMSEKRQIAAQTLRSVKELRHQMTAKVEALNKLQRYFAQLLQHQRKSLSFAPTPKALFSQQQIDRLSFSLQGPLKVDCLTQKKVNLGRQCELRCSELREEIKTTKLKLSLCEMEYKELMASNARRISDRIDNSK